MNCRLKVKEDVIAELHGNVLKKDEEIASLRSLLDEQKNKNNVRSFIFLPPAGNVILKTVILVCAKHACLKNFMTPWVASYCTSEITINIYMMTLV